jgi:hypothetical protein
MRLSVTPPSRSPSQGTYFYVSPPEKRLQLLNALRQKYVHPPYQDNQVTACFDRQLTPFQAFMLGVKQQINLVFIPGEHSNRRLGKIAAHLQDGYLDLVSPPESSKLPWTEHLKRALIRKLSFPSTLFFINPQDQRIRVEEDLDTCYPPLLRAVESLAPEQTLTNKEHAVGFVVPVLQPATLVTLAKAHQASFIFHPAECSNKGIWQMTDVVNSRYQDFLAKEYQTP